MVEQQVLHVLLRELFAAADNLFNHHEAGARAQRTSGFFIANDWRKTFQSIVWAGQPVGVVAVTHISVRNEARLISRWHQARISRSGIHLPVAVGV